MGLKAVLFFGRRQKVAFASRRTRVLTQGHPLSWAVFELECWDGIQRRRRSTTMTKICGNALDLSTDFWKIVEVAMKMVL